MKQANFIVAYIFPSRPTPPVKTFVNLDKVFFYIFLVTAKNLDVGCCLPLYKSKQM